ncbi:hypothetical protein K2X30_15905 [bacterium]|jgi:tetratricopeptide (TPR) repeat protein|nr:hypothetical protein [bacterium]
MASTFASGTSTELDRKSLKKADEFVVTTKKIFESVSQQTTLMVALAVILVAGGVGAGLYFTAKAKGNQEAANALFLAKDNTDKLRDVVQKFPSSRAAFEARLALGDYYFNHNEAEKSLEWYQGAADTAHNGFEKALSLYSLGYSFEKVDKHADAATAFEKGVGMGIAGLKGELLLGAGRNYSLAKNKAKAVSTLDQVIKELPNSPYSHEAQKLKGQLEK